MSDADDGGGGGVGGEEVYSGRTEPALVSVSDSYSEDKKISVCDSRSSSSPAYTVTDYLSTDYCLKGNVNNFDLRRSFYSKQLFLRTNCCSSA